jgi:hypothetical protein
MHTALITNLVRALVASQVLPKEQMITVLKQSSDQLRQQGAEMDDAAAFLDDFSNTL